MQCPNCSNLCRDTDRICEVCRQPIRRPGNRAKIVSFTSSAFAAMGVAVMLVIHQQHTKGGQEIAGALTVGLFGLAFAGVGAVVGHVIALVIGA